jgi:hypothetical protein
MKIRILAVVSLCLFLFFRTAAGLSTTFDERLWENYAEINDSAFKGRGGLVGVYLNPEQIGAVNVKNPFADMRVVADSKEEVPWQIITRKPEMRFEEWSVSMRNLSLVEDGKTWLELVVKEPEPLINAVEIVTADSDFTRRVQVLGSPDGKTWKILRRDGVIFDIPRGERLHHTSISFPQTSFRHLALKITNEGAKPLSIQAVKVMHANVLQGATYTIYGKMEKAKTETAGRESSIIVPMERIFPVDRLLFSTPERNFQRSVEVQVRRDGGDWQRWAQGTIFRYDTATMQESRLDIEIPEIATAEFKLVFRNYDSPPLTIDGFEGRGYRRLLVFKQQRDRKLYLFWGNPADRQPRYDLAEILAKQNPDAIPVAMLGETRPNGHFAGNRARLPFTERYKLPLYAAVALAIAMLVFVQYRVLRQVKRKPEEETISDRPSDARQ